MLAYAPLLGAVLGLAEPAPGQTDEPRFSGDYATSFGPLRLRVEGERFVGNYTIEGNPGELYGEVDQEQRLRFQYYGPGSDGEGWFELRDDGARLEGRWRMDDALPWMVWNGRRDTALEHLPALRANGRLEGVIEESDPGVLSNSLLQWALDVPVRGKWYRVETPPDGPWFLELRAEPFDAYLVLRDLAGNVLAEDDSGRLGAPARIALPAARAEAFVVQVCAIDGRVGPFALGLESGTPPEPTLGALRRAEITAAEAHARRTEAAWGTDHPETATALEELGLVIGHQGYLDEALSLFERALRIREAAYGPDHLETSDSMDDMASVLGELGRYAEARPLVERALRIRERELGPDHMTTTFSVANLAGLLGAQGLYEESEALYRRCLANCEAKMGPQHYFTALSSGSIGMALLAQGRDAEALPYAERALRIYEQTVGPDRIETGGGAYELALVLEHQGLYEDALPLLERCLGTCERVLGGDHPYTADSAGALARVLERLGRFEEARTYHEQALDICERNLGPAHPRTAKRLNELAGLLAGQGELELAFEYSLRAIDATEAQVARTLSGLTENERLRYASQVRATLELFLSLCEGNAGGELGDRAGYERLLAWKGRVSRSLFFGGAEDSALERSVVVELRAVQRRLADELYQTEVADRAEHELLLDELRRQRNALELELVRAREAASADAESAAEVRGLEALSNSLPAGAASVDFYVHRAFRPGGDDAGEGEQAARWTAPRLTAWVVAAGAPEVARIDLGPAAPIEAATRRFLEQLVDTRGIAPEDDASDPARAAVELTRLLWQPLAGEIGAAALVLVSPDTFLGTLPFETLQLDDGTFLIERHGFVYLQDVASLPRLAEPVPSATPRLLLAGGIDYRSRDAAPEHVAVAADSRGSYRGTWRPLSSTREEVDAIADIHAEAAGDEAPRTLLARTAATEERIKLELPDCRYVHLATHGYFQPEGLPSMWKNAKEEDEETASSLGMRETERRITGLLPGLLSGLVFAGANAPPERGRDNGLLTAEEVSTLDLGNCDLVVLSACETGLGRAESGEGLLGLRRAFRQAGARTVVSSLWSVKDEATSELMTSFYENLWLRELGKLEALRRAQLDVLERNRVEYGHGLPSTWGAFVLDGHWN